MKMPVVVIVLLSLAWGPSNSIAQEYEPRYRMPRAGSEILLVFISTSSCIGNSQERLDDAVRGAKHALRERIEGGSQAFFAIGAAAEWSVEAGLDYLIRGISPNFDDKDFGPWDEVQAGRNWLNASAVDYIWRDVRGRPVVPQVVLIERPVTVGERGIEVGEDRLLARALGSEEIIDWFDQGMPLELE